MKELQHTTYELSQLQKEQDERGSDRIDDNFHSPETFARDAGMEQWLDEVAEFNPMTDAELEDMRIRDETGRKSYAVLMQKERLSTQLRDWKGRRDANEPWVREQISLLEQAIARVGL